MEDKLFKNALVNLPKFFDSGFDSKDGIIELFENLKSILSFDSAFIFFLTPESFQLKYKSELVENITVGEEFHLNEKLRAELFSEETIKTDSNNKIINYLGLDSFNSFLITKLSIRKTIFGFLLLCKKDSDFYGQKEITVAKTISSAISYMIKDIELSDVFKIQLRALKDGILDAKAANKTIKEQNEKVLAADKVKNEFLANVSHELRTPLNAIIGFSEILGTKIFGDLNEKQSEYINDINVSAIHLLGMINEILDISKIEAKATMLNISHFSVSRPIDEVVNILKPLADKKKIKIEKKYSKDKEIFADYQKINQILYNLLSNAIKFSPESGKITVDVDFKEKNVSISVSDDGVGIAPENHARIFEKFVQLEDSYTKKESSTGLGLTITKELVQMHGGTISVKSDIGKGAKFVVLLPQKTEF